MTQQTRGPNEGAPAAEVAVDENKLIAERRAKLAAIRETGIASPMSTPAIASAMST